MLTDGYIDRTSVMMMMAGMLLLLLRLLTIVAPKEYLERKIESAAEHKRHRKKWFHLMDINSTYYNQKIASSKLMRFIVLVFFTTLRMPKQRSVIGVWHGFAFV